MQATRFGGGGGSFFRWTDVYIRTTVDWNWHAYYKAMHKRSRSLELSRGSETVWYYVHNYPALANDVECVWAALIGWLVMRPKWIDV